MTMPRLTKEQKAHAHLCSVQGCGRAWSSTFNGKLCALHNQPPAPLPSIPTTPPARAWSDTDKDEDAV